MVVIVFSFLMFASFFTITEIITIITIITALELNIFYTISMVVMVSAITKTFGKAEQVPRCSPGLGQRSYIACLRA